MFVSEHNLEPPERGCLHPSRLRLTVFAMRSNTVPHGMLHSSSMNNTMAAAYNRALEMSSSTRTNSFT